MQIEIVSERLRHCLICFALFASCFFNPVSAQNGIETLSRMKYGIIVHYVPELTVNSGGAVIADINNLANSFDATAFANDLANAKVEYVIFTAWHFRMKPLYPSSVMTSYRGAGSSSSRDVIRAMIDAVKAKGIRVLLYTHPRDGHDFASDSEKTATGWGAGSGAVYTEPNLANFNFQKWNNFILDCYRELLNRYGNDIDGLFIDEGDANGKSELIVDYPRLKATIKIQNPNLVLVQNSYGSSYSADFGVKEYYYQGEMANTSNGDTWPAFARKSTSALFNDNWWASKAAGSYAPKLNAVAMYRYIVLQAGINQVGGGINWAAGPYASGGWETGVLPTLNQVGSYVSAVDPAIRNTYPSTSYPTGDGKRIMDLSWGVATRSTDNSFEFIHVLKPPTGKTLTLPVPQDSKTFSGAVLLPSGNAVALTQSQAGVSLTLGAADNWNSINTVIKLAVVSPANTPGAPGVWVQCASEGGTCSFDGIRTVAYGANARFTYQQVDTTTNCNNTKFGDPIGAVVKSCFYLQAYGGPSPAGFTYCADNEQICAFNGTGSVRYGANGTYATLTASKQINCNYNLFGDPVPYVVKSCYVQAGNNLSNQIVRIRNRTNGRWLTGNCTADGCAVTEVSSDTGASQRWQLTRVGYGYHKITNQLDTRVLNGGGRYAGYPVSKWSNVTSFNLMWRLVQKPNGYYMIQNATDNLVLNGGGYADGYQVSEWDDVESTNLEWELVP